MQKRYLLDYVDDVEYKKLENAVRKYNRLAFSKLIFEYYPELRKGNFLGELISENDDGSVSYELKLPTDHLFSHVHGEIKVMYRVYNQDANRILLEKITPDKILLEGHKSQLDTYKGVMISKENAEKDMFKINLMQMMENK